MPKELFAGPRNINLYYLHETFRHAAMLVQQHLLEEWKEDLPLSAGMWGGSYLVADEIGVSRTNVVRLYSIVSLPQNTCLDDPQRFDDFIQIYRRTLQDLFGRFALELVDPHWGETIPYTNHVRPTTTLQMWDARQRVKFLRAFFVWNRAPWSEAIIYDMVRNVKQIKELLNLDHRPQKKESQELKFLLQDVLIIYFTLRPILTPDFVEHAQPIIDEAFDSFIQGLHDPERIEELYTTAYTNALVYGFEEALQGPYGRDGLDIQKVEDWPPEKINWVPEELKKTLAPALEAKFHWFRKNLKKRGVQT